MEELIKVILDWWEDHEFDSYCRHGEEYNTYDEPPEFVKIAQRLAHESMIINKAIKVIIPPGKEDEYDY